MKASLLVFGAAIVMAGCGPSKYNVAGASGHLYTAPDLCQALVECKAKESSCFYQATKTTTQDGKSFDELYCKEVTR